MGNHYDLAVTCLVVGFDIQVLGRITTSRIYVFLDGGEARKLVWENVDGRPSIVVYAYSQSACQHEGECVVKGCVDRRSRPAWWGNGMVVGSRHG